MRPQIGRKMKRVMVIGCSGAGKSTFALELGRITGIKVTHLDRLNWKAGWKEVSRDEFDSKLGDVLKEDSWIIDGNYSRTMEKRLEKVQVVFYFRLSTAVCLYGYLTRLIKGKLGKKRIDMTEGCNERFDWDFVKFIAGFQRDNAERTEKMLEKYPYIKVVRFSSRRQAEKFLIGLEEHYDKKL